MRLLAGPARHASWLSLHAPSRASAREQSHVGYHPTGCQGGEQSEALREELNSRARCPTFCLVSLLVDSEASADALVLGQRYPVGTDPRSVAVADSNGDTFPDLATADWEGIEVSVLPGNGDGTFQAAVAFVASGSSVAMADLDGDTDRDLVTNVNVLLNRSDPALPAVPVLSLGVLILLATPQAATGFVFRIRARPTIGASHT
ncbi:MAG: VCBS repeat-containing protein [Myxococcota bacterium]|nr:VCBS repeat-containing protein [Myxococcota bacterium]